MVCITYIEHGKAFILFVLIIILLVGALSFKFCYVLSIEHGKVEGLEEK
jgi:hypothetical protein